MLEHAAPDDPSAVDRLLACHLESQMRRLGEMTNAPKGGPCGEKKFLSASRFLPESPRASYNQKPHAGVHDHSAEGVRWHPTTTAPSPSWIGDLKAGGDSAAQHLWERYFDRLVHLARARLRTRAGRCRRGRGRRGLQCLRQLLPGRRQRPLPAARRPRRPLAAAGRHHGAQGPRPARAPGAQKRGGGRLVGESALIGADAAEARRPGSPRRQRAQPRDGGAWWSTSTAGCATA